MNTAYQKTHPNFGVYSSFSLFGRQYPPLIPVSNSLRAAWLWTGVDAGLQHALANRGAGRADRRQPLRRSTGGRGVSARCPEELRAPAMLAQPLRPKGEPRRQETVSFWLPLWCWVPLWCRYTNTAKALISFKVQNVAIQTLDR